MPTLAPTTAGLPLRTAMERRDLAAVMDAFTPDAVLHSPLTEKLAFRGREEIGVLTTVLFDAFEEFHYTDEMRTADAAFLVARARIGGEDIEMVDQIRLAPDGRISEQTVFFRPLPATAAALRVLGAGLGSRRGRVRGAIISGLTRPLGLMTRAGDRIGVRLIRPALQARLPVGTGTRRSK
ncbi:MAG TPA: nuclear transport factor 2 family protein [Solirubrobacteraceae bacterium]|jgi:hypothetical protein